MKRVKKFKNKNVIFLLFSFCIIAILMLSVSYAKFTTNLSISEKGKIITFPKGIYYYKERGADVGYFYTDGSLTNAMTSYSEATKQTEKISTLKKFLENVNQKTNLYMVSTYTEAINSSSEKTANMATFSEDIDVYGFNIEGKSYYETDTESNSGTLGYLFKIDTAPNDEYETGNLAGYYIFNEGDSNTHFNIHSKCANSDETFDIFTSSVSNLASINFDCMQFINENKKSYSNLLHGYGNIHNTNIYGNFRISLEGVPNANAFTIGETNVYDFNDSEIEDGFKNFLSSNKSTSININNLNIISSSNNDSDLKFSKSLISLYDESLITIQDDISLKTCCKYGIENINNTECHLQGQINVYDASNISSLSELINTAKKFVLKSDTFNLGTITNPLAINKGKYIDLDRINGSSRIYVKSKDEDTLNSGGSVVIAKALDEDSAKQFSACFLTTSDEYIVETDGNSIVIVKRTHSCYYYYKEIGSDIGYFYKDNSLSQIMTDSSGANISSINKFAEALTSEANLYMVSTYTENFTSSSSTTVTFSQNVNIYGYNIPGKSSYEKADSSSGTLGYLFKFYKTQQNSTTYNIAVGNNAVLKCYSKDCNSDEVFDIFLYSGYRDPSNIIQGKKEFINTNKNKYSNAIRGCARFQNVDLYGNFYMLPQTFGVYYNITLHDFDDSTIENKRTNIIASPTNSSYEMYAKNILVDENTCTFSASDFKFLAANHSRDHIEIQDHNLWNTLAKYGVSMSSEAHGGTYTVTITEKSIIDLISNMIKNFSYFRLTEGVHKIGSEENPIVIPTNKYLMLRGVSANSRVYIKSGNTTAINSGSDIKLLVLGGGNIGTLDDFLPYFTLVDAPGYTLKVSGNYIIMTKEVAVSALSDTEEETNTDNEESSTITSSGDDPPAD